MAWWYVNSAASGSHAGTSWVNACTSLSQLATLGTPPAAGDNIAMLYTSAETYSTATTITFAGTVASPIYIYSTDNINAPPLASDLKPGASVQQTGAGAGLTFNGVIYFSGVTFLDGNNNSSGIFFSNSNGVQQKLDGCFINLNGAAGSSINLCKSPALSSTMVNNTQFGFTGAGTYLANEGNLYWSNTPAGLTGGAVPTILVLGATGGTTCIIEAVDLSASGSGKTIFGAGSGPGVGVVKDCKLGASVTIAAAPLVMWYDVYNIRSDSAATDYRLEKYSYAGTQTTSTSIVRTGGMNIGGTPVSWTIVSAAHCAVEFPFVAMPIRESNPTIGSSITATMYGVLNSATIPTNAQVWMDIEYLGSSGSPLGSFAIGGVANNLTTGTNLTADSSSIWGSQAPARQNNTLYTSGTSIISVADAASSCQLFFCTSTGTSASSEPVGYATVTDGNTVTDGTAQFLAGMRFSLAVSFTPQLAGDVTARIKVGTPSATYYIDPLIVFNPQ